MDTLDSVRQSYVGTNNIFFTERIGKVSTVLRVGSIAVVAVTHETWRPQPDTAFDGAFGNIKKVIEEEVTNSEAG